MDQTEKCFISICASCRQNDEAYRPGHDLKQHLGTASKLTLYVVGKNVEVEGFAYLAACNRTWTVAFWANAKTSWLLREIDPEQDINDLVAFASQYAASGKGWFRAAERPGKLRRTAPGREPSLVIRSDRISLK